MQASALWLATAVGWIILLGASAQGNCIYNYTEQPPASLDCSLEDELQLRCTATGPRGSALSIDWFRDSMPLLQSNSDVSIQETPTEGRVVSILTQQRLEFNLGSYYCQLSVNGNTLQTVPSDSFELTGRHVNLGGMDCSMGPHFKAENKCAGTVLPTPSVAAAHTSQLSMTPTTQTVMMSLPSLNTSPLHTPSPTNEPSTTQAATSDTVTDGSTNTSGGSTSLQEVWLYVVVTIAAVFAMIIIILTILCVGLCLRKSQTADLETQKEQERQGLHEQFSTIGTSALSNGFDQRHPDIKGFTTTTQLSNHSQSITVPETSDYNILGERDYEVINVVHSQPAEYHHLQRPSMQRSRAATYGFSSTGNGIRDMRSMTSVTYAGNHATAQELMRGDSTTAPLPPPKEGKMAVHPHRNLNFAGEQGKDMALHNPTVRPSVANSQFLERDDSTTQLLPNSSITSRTTFQTSDTLESDVHESLYSPAVGISGRNPAFYHVLDNIPETGTMFPEPSYPSAFPVHEYDYVPTVLSHYETPVPSKKGTSSFPTATTISSDYAEGFTTGNTTGGFASSTLSSDYPKSSIAGFTDSDTADFTGGSTPDCTADSTTDITAGSAIRAWDRNVNGDPTSNVPGMTKFTASTAKSRSLPGFPNVTSVDHDNLTAKSSTINPTFVATENSGAVDNSTCTETSDFSGPIIFPHMLPRETRRNHYKKLDPATMEPVLKYTKIHIAQKTDV